jgi:hypothetical protein
LKAFLKGTNFIFGLFVIWRLLLFIPLIFSNYLLPYRTGSEFTNIWRKIDPYFPVNNFLIWPWANFDGVHYLSIAGNGYTTDMRFFPLFPVLINITSRIFGSGIPFGAIQFFSGFFIANFCFFLSLIVFYKIIVLDFSKDIANWSIFFLLIFPTSFFFVSLYSESLFLLLTLLTFYFARRKNWILVGVFGLFLSATRLVGVLILPALLFEFLKEESVIKKIKEGKERFKLVVSLLLLMIIPFGLLAYAWFNLTRWGNAFSFLLAQGDLGNSRSVSAVVLPVQTIFRYIKLLTNFPVNQYEWWIALLELLTFFFVSFLLFIAWYKRIRASYIIFASFAFLIPAFSGTFSALPRYSLVLFPVFIALALIKSKKIKFIYSGVSLALLFILLMLFSRGYFVA